MDISLEPTDVATLVREIAVSFGAMHQNPGLDVLCRAGGVPTLMVDPHRLRQIAFNFVGNAIKFTKKGFIEIRVSFRPDEPGGKVGVFRMDVEDTGCGISEEDQKKLAMPFVQVGHASSKRAGTGLGLHICRQLAMAMGGDMEIASVLGKGTTISIVVPGVKVAEDGTTGTDGTEGSKPASPTAQVPSVSAVPVVPASHRLLIADDTKMNQIVLKTMFAKLGVTDMIFADNGREALAILKDPSSAPFDFVLTDLIMPEMTGEELVQAIRADPALKSLKVYLFTAEVEMKDAHAAKGFDGILLKPANLESLKKLLA